MDVNRSSTIFSVGSDICFTNINLTIDKTRCCRTVSSEKILQNLNGICKSGEMTAIMGPSGCGKTSLLDILAARKDTQGLEGSILINGKKHSANFKNNSGYVVQDDVVLGTLTVKENLLFSANLRLPRNVPDKEERVEDAMKELGLEHIANSLVGTPLKRGISGGQRKRVNIGMALLTAPSVLFLDEPTSGLDSTTANLIMKWIQKIAKTGRTVIFSIHQPRYSIFELFDRLILLSKGRMCFHGSREDAMSYFNELGYECQTFNNPADFYLDILNGDESRHEKSPIITDSTANDNEGKVEFRLKNPSPDCNELSTAFDDIFRKSNRFQSLKSEMTMIVANSANEEKNKFDKEIGYATGPMYQFLKLSNRSIKEIYRNPVGLFLQIVTAIVFSLFLGLIFRGVGNDSVTGEINRTGVLFFISLNLVMPNLAAISVFLEEKTLFLHENSNGYYRVSVYLISKVFFNIIPLKFLNTIIYTVIGYFLIGLKYDASSFFTFLFTATLLSITATCLIMLFGSFASSFAVGNLLGTFVLIIMILFAGVFAKLDSIDAYLRWISWISIFRYAIQAFNINEFKDLELCSNGTCNSNAGNEYLDRVGISYKSPWDLWSNHVALGVLCTIFICLSYISLLKTKKMK